MKSKHSRIYISPKFTKNNKVQTVMFLPAKAREISHDLARGEDAEIPQLPSWGRHDQGCQAKSRPKGNSRKVGNGPSNTAGAKPQKEQDAVSENILSIRTVRG